MTDTIPTAAPEPGLLARAIGILTSPRKTYEAVVQHPRPVGILFLCVLVIALATGLPQFTESGRQAVLDMQIQQVEKFTGQPASDEMYAQMQARSKYSAYFTIASIFIASPIIAMIIAGIYWFVFNVIMGGTAVFKQVLAVVTHSMVVGAVGVILGAPIQYLKGTMSSQGPFTLAALVPTLDEKSFLVGFLGFINPFTIWGIVVVAIGLGVLYKRNTTTIATTLLILYGLFAAGVATFLSTR
jgi:hypothetical protein